MPKNTDAKQGPRLTLDSAVELDQGDAGRALRPQRRRPGRAAGMQQKASPAGFLKILQELGFPIAFEERDFAKPLATEIQNEINAMVATYRAATKSSKNNFLNFF